MLWQIASAVLVLVPERVRPTRKVGPHSGTCAPPRPVRLDGNLSGDITTSQPIIVSESAVIRADVRAPSVVVTGQVFGDVTATTSIELRYPARLVGNLAAPRIEIEPGVHFEGICRMGPDPLRS
jgi:cytoskeletal protein CcmA (bactofilin family)